MKVSNIFLLILCLSFVSTSIFAQKEKEEEKVIIIKQSHGSDEEIEEIIIKKGAEGEESIIVIDGETIEIEGIEDADFNWIEQTEGERQVEVNVEENNGEKAYRIRIKDENGGEEVIDWKGKGDLPEDIRKELEEKGIHISDSEVIEIEGEKEVKVIVEVHEDGKKKKKHKKKKVTKNVIIIDGDQKIEEQ
ncbi:MAG: hypothetical protein MI974_04060 [Chitinophagales bacterium]|nr:hypothetical protein [Chitinophagales bacterium]